MISPIAELSNDSKIWIYTANRDITVDEQEAINTQILNFCEQWTAHNNDLKAAGMVYMGRFIILMVDENMNEASGCSIDKSVHFIKQLENDYKLRLFQRDLVAVKQNDSFVFTPLGNLKNIADENSLVCDTLVSTKADFDDRFFTKIKNSWLKRFL